ncbi:MAG: GDP-L-fucose synthase [Bacteroidetes bacterium]|nr:GDP-L-fucose synthase [Bacteroidota bacterium]
MKKNAKIYIAGHLGMVGSAIHRNLIGQGFSNFVLRTLEELDLTRQQAVEDFFEKERPEYVILAAAKVGGIHANNVYRAQFIYENLQIQNNIIHQSYLTGVKKLLFLGSSCIYPKNAPQPLKEEYLLTGLLESTNEPYAIAKIAGIKMCESYTRQYGYNFISVMPTNLYGPNDNYNLETSHVLPAIIRKVHLAHCLEKNDWQTIRKDLNKRPIESINGNSTDQEITNILNKYGILANLPTSQLANFPTSQLTNLPTSITLWGTGKVFREFMHVDDMASACAKVMEDVSIDDLINIDKSQITTFLNIGTGIDQTITDLVQVIKKIIGFEGEISYDHTKPDGTYRKLLDVSRLQKLGFKPKYSLEGGIENVYKRYLEDQ